MNEINPRNPDFYYLPFDGYQRLITRHQICHVNDDIVEMLNNGPIVDIYMNQM